VTFYDCRDAGERERGIDAAVTAVRAGGLVVLPTDTVYGVGGDAFLPGAAQAVLDAKGRGRHMPAPVLADSLDALAPLVAELPEAARELAGAFWPGGLTLVLRHRPELTLDLGETAGTVAVRLPRHPVAVELLRRVGPMAVSSANRTGQPTAATATEAREQLGAAVRVYLEAGPSPDLVPSTIVDVTGPVPRVLRAGAIPAAKLRDVVPTLVGPAEEG
jgi:L-threonylcarbamoyladenylate synthase